MKSLGLVLQAQQAPQQAPQRYNPTSYNQK
jgi:hypothetical protein